VHEDKFVITGSDDGGVRMWSVDGREQTLQFLVVNQVCTVIASSDFILFILLLSSHVIVS